MAGHDHLGAPLPLTRGLRWVVGVVAVATVVGLVVLWPRGDAPDLSGTTATLEYVEAVVEGIDTAACQDPAEGLPTDCRVVSVTVVSGSTEGEEATFLVSALDFSAPELAEGDRVVLSYNPLAPPEFRYVFAEFDRGAPLIAVLVLFVVVVVAFGRWKGVRALAGLAVSLAVIGVFLLPALIRDGPAVAVALVTTSVIAFAALYLAHGVSWSTTVALLGSLASVVLITVLAAVVVGIAELSGLSDESFQVLRVTADALDPRGVLLAGIVIGALGVLDDVTVTQASAVVELHRADPSLSAPELYRAAIRIGRDHVASTVNTLVLAYVGASLALMLFFYQEGRAASEILNREVIAIEIVRALIGGVGLIAAVPLTTALAAWTTVDRE